MPEKAYVRYNIVKKPGNPVDEIIRDAEARQYDLVVMGRHGHGPLKDAMIGDTVRRIVRRSRIPVLVVRVPKVEEEG